MNSRYAKYHCEDCEHFGGGYCTVKEMNRKPSSPICPDGHIRREEGTVETAKKDGKSNMKRVEHVCTCGFSTDWPPAWRRHLSANIGHAEVAGCEPDPTADENPANDEPQAADEKAEAEVITRPAVTVPVEVAVIIRLTKSEHLLRRELIDTYISLVISELQASIDVVPAALACSVQDRMERLQELVREAIA